MPIRECLWLIKNGITEGTAFSLDEITRTSFSIIFAELGGQEFDRQNFRFKDKRADK